MYVIRIYLMIYTFLLHLVVVTRRRPIEYCLKIAVPSLYDLVVHCMIYLHYSTMVDLLRRMVEIFYHVTLCDIWNDGEKEGSYHTCMIW
ncbi:hypothetical protein PILCRDRAFT_321231 [Piloderma croceum F 1598]|uniref:Uncharacterized protein n=1 Tax=Piloderma croceum (strain F 1598) TaxID=765440 RepID=A0A0C3FQ70_PILCF|nr:hypothetical protein PILCRDRAFT_321231 [Piloderma croceum F 1598]